MRRVISSSRRSRSSIVRPPKRSWMTRGARTTISRTRWRRTCQTSGAAMKSAVTKNTATGTTGTADITDTVMITSVTRIRIILTLAKKIPTATQGMPHAGHKTAHARLPPSWTAAFAPIHRSMQWRSSTCLDLVSASVSSPRPCGPYACGRGACTTMCVCVLDKACTHVSLSAQAYRSVRP